MSDDTIVRKVRQRRSSKFLPKTFVTAQKRKSSSSVTDGQPDPKRTPSDLSLIFAEGDSFFNDVSGLMDGEDDTAAKPRDTASIQTTFQESEDMFACSDDETWPPDPLQSTPILGTQPLSGKHKSTPTSSVSQIRRTPKRSCKKDKIDGRSSSTSSNRTPAKLPLKSPNEISLTPVATTSKKGPNTTQTSSPALKVSQHNDFESQSISSLPPSALDIRSRLLSPNLTPEQSQYRRSRIGNITSKPKFLNENVVNEHKDRGPFYGLPAKVEQLFREQKGIEELFPWQIECLTSQAVQKKQNLLYSLPTSGGKTLVAEIIMLQELLCYRKNCIFVLPYVSLVQEKIRSMAPFALELGFYLEEYAGTRGRFPPQKRRFKKSMFICTIEKAHALLNSLVVERRLHEIGLVVIDEVHMIGEDSGRGANLESFITKIKYVNRNTDRLLSSSQEKVNNSLNSSEEKENSSPGLKSTIANNIQIISMSATVGNLKELSIFLESQLYTDSWRPVKLEEYIKVGQEIHKVEIDQTEQFRQIRKLNISNYTQEIKKIDEDYLTNLVLEVYPEHSCLVFCDTKRRCENVADLLCKVMSNQAKASNILEHRQKDRESLLMMLSQEGSGFMCQILSRTIRFGVAYHHSGLTMDERKIIEEGYLSGSIGILCCTSTLAAGVNLPARRVIIRSPFMGRNQLSHTQYKQMTGRAGRAGLDSHGESFLMVKQNQVKLVEDVVTAPIEHCITSLHLTSNSGLATLVLNSMYLGLIETPGEASAILDMTLMSCQANKLNINMAQSLQKALDILLTNNLVTLADNSGGTQQATQQTCGITTKMKPSRIGRATVMGNVQLDLSGQLYNDLKDARPHLAVDTSLHILYLITPYELSQSIYYSPSIYYKIYFELSESELQVARFLGVTEPVVAGLINGRGASKKVKPVLARFYLSMALLDLWNLSPIHQVAEKFSISRGEVQSLMTSAASFASSVYHFCLEIEEFWAYQELLEPFVKRLAHCCSPDLLPLLELPGVKSGRARQLLAAGYSSLQLIAKADPKHLVANIQHMTHKAAKSIVESAKLILIDKAEALHDEADILLDLKSLTS